MRTLRDALSALALIAFGLMIVTAAERAAYPSHDPVSPDFQLAGVRQ